MDRESTRRARRPGEDSTVGDQIERHQAFPDPPERPGCVSHKVVTEMRKAKFKVGDVVRHRIYPFRGVVYDVDPEFANTEEWWQAIPPAIRPRKDQPYYHLYAENAQGPYIAYVSEQNLLPDDSDDPVEHPQIGETFTGVGEDGRYIPHPRTFH